MGLNSVSTFRHEEPSAKDVGLCAEALAGKKNYSCYFLEERMLRGDFITPHNYLEGGCGEVGSVGQPLLPDK